MEEKKGILSKEEEEKVSGGEFNIYNPDSILKKFCRNCGSTDLTRNMKSDSHNRKIFVFHCNSCGNQWETLPMPTQMDQGDLGLSGVGKK